MRGMHRRAGEIESPRSGGRQPHRHPVCQHVFFTAVTSTILGRPVCCSLSARASQFAGQLVRTGLCPPLSTCGPERCCGLSSNAHRPGPFGPPCGTGISNPARPLHFTRRSELQARICQRREHQPGRLPADLGEEALGGQGGEAARHGGEGPRRVGRDVGEVKGSEERVGEERGLVVGKMSLVQKLYSISMKSPGFGVP